MSHTHNVNRLLAALDPVAYRRLEPELERVRVARREVLFEPGERIRHVFFPESAVLVMVTLMENGDSIESGTVGREGAMWVSAIFGAPTMPCQTMVAIDGDVLKIDVGYLEREVNRDRNFRDVLSHYSHALLIHSMRATACNGLHSVAQRCARWILTTLDRVDPTDRFSITQEFLADLLGSARPTVTEIVNDMARSGAIRLNRGVITVGDRAELERTACECYEVIKAQFRLIGVKGPENLRAPADDWSTQTP
jgi:CRP-like cAMP-binding protein